MKALATGVTVRVGKGGKSREAGARDLAPNQTCRPTHLLVLDVAKHSSNAVHPPRDTQVML